MAEYSPEDARIAEQLVHSFFNRKGEDIELEPELAISDVESDATEFIQELSLLKYLGAEVPAIRVADEAVPVSLKLLFGVTVGWPRMISRRLMYHRWWMYPFLYEFYEDFLRRVRREEYLWFITINRKEARSTFIRRSIDFLATRISFVRNWRDENLNERDSQGLSTLTLPQRLRGPQIRSPGCTFTVSSNSNGLRVFWSGAYYISPNYFGYPTSPVSSVLQSGTYVFGVDGGAYGSDIQWDPNAVISLPGSPSIHLNY